MTVRVSVVIATYNSGEALLTTLESLAAQSLPADQFEVVLADDGSSDGTPTMIRAYAADHPNVRLVECEHTGWPGRPRNVGTRQARGAYVFYMDHDDYMFPEALERMAGFAEANASDVVLAKEACLGQNTPGWDTWRHDIPKVAQIDRTLLECMTPHKLFRRAFVLDQNVRFPEGPVRLEDYNFNAQAYVRAETISVLSSYPCYQWIIHQSNAHKSGRLDQGYWASYRDSMSAFEQELPDGPTKDAFRVRWFESRVCNRLGGRKFRGSSEQTKRSLLESVTPLLEYFPAHLDERLKTPNRLRVILLRRGDIEALSALAALEPHASAQSSACEATWRGPVLSLTCEGWLASDGDRYPLRRCGTRVLRDVPDPLRAHFTDAELDQTDSIHDARLDVSVRSRATGVEWIVPTTGRLELSPDSRPVVRYNLQAQLDPHTAAGGEPLPDDLWDVYARIAVFGHAIRMRIPYDGPDSPVIVQARPAVMHSTAYGRLTLDLAGRARKVVRADGGSLWDRPATTQALRVEDLGVTHRARAGAGQSALRRRARLFSPRGVARVVRSRILGGAERCRQ